MRYNFQCIYTHVNVHMYQLKPSVEETIISSKELRCPL